MTINLGRPIYVLSWVYTLFIVLPAVCQGQSTNSSSNNGFSGSFHIDKSGVTMVIIFVSVLFSATTLSYYIYRLCCIEAVTISLPFQPSAADGGPTCGGLDHDIIETFPILIYSDVKNVKIGGESMECAICLSEFEDHDTLRFIPICHHVFHPDCIDAWLSSRTTCPFCRANLTEKFEQEPPETNGDNSQSESIETNAPDQIVIVTASEDQNVIVPPRPKKVHGKFSRSHSTGHSMVQSTETTERYTLRLPVDVRRQILMANAKLNRVRSMNLLLDTEGSSTKGRRSYACDEGSGKDTRLKSLQIERPKKWVFCATPPFVTRGGGGRSVRIARFGNDREGSTYGGSVRITKFGNDREGSFNSGSVGNARSCNDVEELSVNGKTRLLASIKMPDFFSRRSDGVEESSSARLSV
ncbi:putative RING/U-box superfamily protein [Tripterygium wilfordii]|uniref:RING-type E3 ubiquitin transferase n=1 Tax=Tripterygium wilfordii TaxID=458696 RepID=A0A7J7DUF0_TRIWF|nr:RING-H2 finger protein ATL32-like [Tripterygium wilfordii]XP_038697533.1 RING-H2 finger protein ATL32-like [Tripterygium wilfordii]KAF5749756.1 putative RING/U-box superfamily protein [Tripterygium wilfordii]KAF5749766.1 putative RING/U-box superfamily protein [Tripterygium wilfordii]